jgi:hypothetical protein
MSERKEASPAEVTQRREERLQSRSRMPIAEREQLKQLHWMHCPKCGQGLDEMVFRGVRIDKCFACGGVYLDDGELEQLTGKPGWFEAMRQFFSRGSRD